MNATTDALWDDLPLGPGVTLLHRDANGVAAYDKPAGVLSHPNERGDEGRSLLTCHYDLESQCFVWSGPEGERRVWLLNRLDGATSGVILVASDGEVAAVVREQFAKKRVRKTYQALVFGKPAERMQLWRDLISVRRKGGQVRSSATSGNIPAITQFNFLSSQQGTFSTSLIRLEPQTGRSHQLRVQCAKRHLPIVGDQTYGDFRLNREFTKTTGSRRLFLHSVETSLSYEFRGATHKFKALAPLPEEFKRRY